MEHNDNCLIKIQSILPSLKGVEQKAALHILEHPEKVLNSSIASLSRQIGIAESSIIRFCRNIGYQGFASFKINLASSLQQNALHNLDDLTMLSDDSSAAQTMQHVFAQTHLALNQTLQIINSESFNQAASLLCNADSLYFFGIGTSAPIVEDAYYRFSRVKAKTFCAVDPYAMLLATSHMNHDSVVIGVSHTGRSRETLSAMKKARSQGAHTISITSYLNSPITRYSDISLVTSAAENNVIHEAITSRITHLSLLDSLYTFITMHDYENSSVKLESINEIMKKARE